MHYPFAFQVAQAALSIAYDNFRRLHDRHDLEADLLAERLADFRAANGHWLECDALYSALYEAYGHQSWRQWLDAYGNPHIDRKLWNPGPVGEAAMRGRRIELIRRIGRE